MASRAAPVNIFRKMGSCWSLGDVWQSLCWLIKPKTRFAIQRCSVKKTHVNNLTFFLYIYGKRQARNLGQSSRWVCNGPLCDDGFTRPHHLERENQARNLDHSSRWLCYGLFCDPRGSFTRLRPLDREKASKKTISLPGAFAMDCFVMIILLDFCILSGKPKQDNSVIPLGGFPMDYFLMLIVLLDLCLLGGKTKQDNSITFLGGFAIDWFVMLTLLFDFCILIGKCTQGNPT